MLRVFAAKAMTMQKVICIEITPVGSERAKPAIWYAGMVGVRFNVAKSISWASIYEVVDGDYKGKVIDPKDCKIVDETQLVNQRLETV
jgi:hypothetical protein